MQVSHLAQLVQVVVVLSMPRALTSMGEQAINVTERDRGVQSPNPTKRKNLLQRFCKIVGLRSTVGSRAAVMKSPLE